MSRNCKVALAVFLSLSANVATMAAGVSVLFVGNSLTQANDLPTDLRLSQRCMLMSMLTRSRPAALSFMINWRSGIALGRLRELQPNFLILQGQSMEPLLAPLKFNYYASLFKTDADRISAKTILFSTWARPAGDPYYKDVTSGGSPAEMQTRLNLAYASLAQNIGATLAPVGLGFERARNDAPAVELLNGTQHPSPAGTYLAAAILFRVIFNSSPVGSNYHASLPATTADTLQRVADSIPLNTAQ